MVNYKKILFSSVGADPKVGQWNLANVHYDPKSLAFKWTGYDTSRDFNTGSMSYNYVGYYDFEADFMPSGVSAGGGSMRGIAMPTEDYLYVFHAIATGGSSQNTHLTRLELPSADNVLGYSKGASNFTTVDIDDGTGYHSNWVNGSDVTADGKHYITFKGPPDTESSYYSGMNKFDTQTDYVISSSDSQSQTYNFTSDLGGGYIYGGIRLFPRKMIVSDRQGDDIYQWSMTSDYDLSTLSTPTSNTNLASFNNKTRDFQITPDGDGFVFTCEHSTSWGTYTYDNLWWIDSSGGNIANLDITRATTYMTKFYLADGGTGITDNQPAGVTFNGRGTQMHVALPNMGYIATWTIGAFDTASDRSTTNQIESQPTGLYLKGDGDRFYTTGYSSDRITEWNMSTSFDVGTATMGERYYFGGQDGSPTDIFFKSDGTKFYMLGNVTDTVYEYSCSTAWDVSTASHNTSKKKVISLYSSSGIFFKADGTEMYLAGDYKVSYQNYDTYLEQYTLSTAWDVSTASFTRRLEIDTSSQAARSIWFKDDGLKMYISGNSGSSSNKIRQFTLSTAWNLSTASEDTSEYFDLSTMKARASTDSSISFSEDGGQLFVTNATAQCIYAFNVYEQ